MSERLKGGCVLSKIELGSDKDNGDVGRMVIDLGVPLEVSAESTCCGGKLPVYLCLDVVE